MPRFQGLFLIHGRVLSGLALGSQGRGWAVVMEMILAARRAGARIAHAPMELRQRLSGRSKVQNPRTILSNVAQVFELAWRLRAQRFLRPVPLRPVTRDR
jgi:hypothetical protein